jgi:hypothetical protein
MGRPGVGTVEDFVAWAQAASEEVAVAYVEPATPELGCVTVTVYGHGRPVSEAAYWQVLRFLEDHGPVNCSVYVVALGASPA